MTVKIFVALVVFAVGIDCTCDKEALKPLEWTGGPYEFSDEATKNLFISSGKYISKNVLATRCQIVDDTAILAIPRYRSGETATLVTVNLKSRAIEPLLTPFPSWAAQEEGNCKALQSVVDIFVDIQGIAWVLDVGVLYTLQDPLRTCPPKAVAISPITGKVLKTLDLSGLVGQASRLQNIVVEYTNDNRPFVYISDAATRSILVFDIKGNKGYRVSMPKVILSGCNKRDVLYIALMRKGCGNNFLVFTYLCGSRVFAIRTDHLQAGSAPGKIIDLGPKPRKIVPLGADGGSAFFFRYEGDSEIFRWDINNAFTTANFIPVHKSSSCFLSTHVVADAKRQRMRTLESSFTDYLLGKVGCGAVQQLNVIAGSC